MPPTRQSAVHWNTSEVAQVHKEYHSMTGSSVSLCRTPTSQDVANGGPKKSHEILMLVRLKHMSNNVVTSHS